MSPQQDGPWAAGRPRKGGKCGGWNNADCEGSPHCPPRCPRFFDDTGRPLLVRPPEEDEWPHLLAMYHGVESRSMGLPPMTPERREHWLGDLRATGWNLVALDGDRVVGHVSVAPSDEPAPELVVFVADDYQARGIGTELVKQAIAYAADRNHDALGLLVGARNDRAIAVYTNVGFDVVDRDIQLEMRLPLDRDVAETVRLAPGERPPDD